MTQHNVDFIVGDFNVRVPFPLLVMCSWIQSFQHLAIRYYGVSVLWTTRVANAQGFSSCPSARMNGMWMSADNAEWQLSLVYLTARTCPCFQYGIDEADEGDVAQQDHMSAHHLTPSAVTSES